MAGGQDTSVGTMALDNMVLDDRDQAGRLIAERLKLLKLDDPLVLAIPRGGIALGYIVAHRLGCELDIITARKLRDPIDPELAIGATLPDGSVFLNEEIISARMIPDSYIESETQKQREEAMRRLKNYRNGRPYPSMAGRDIILVDDGIATGATMMAAARWAKRQLPARIIIAAPVIPRSTLEELSYEADQIVYLVAPASFASIGQFYKNFEQVDDPEAAAMLSFYWNSEIWHPGSMNTYSNS
jgi:putative phosphoribosyl transferase